MINKNDTLLIANVKLLKKTNDKRYGDNIDTISNKMDQKELKKAINQLGRVKKSEALDTVDKKTIERIRKKLYNKIE